MPILKNKDLVKIFEGKTRGNPHEEVLLLARSIAPGINTNLLNAVHDNLISCFAGKHPEFQKNTMPYHNLRHSQMVVLATARLFHGLFHNNFSISENLLLKGLFSAYFHDTGMLLRRSDPAASGSAYIRTHEKRSIAFLFDYINNKKLDMDKFADCATIVMYTRLRSDPAVFAPHPQEIKLAGQVVGSADILAQMADRYYLECLPLLFNEQKEGKINTHKSALDLMEQTSQFYHRFILKRLFTTFSGIMEAMQTHFRVRHAIDRDLYIENMDKNIEYLQRILPKCENRKCIERYLRRIPPAM